MQVVNTHYVVDWIIELSQRILMCRPDYFDVSYEINPWMKNQIGFVNKEEAQRQWNELYNSLINYVEVSLINPIQNCPDLVFTANAGFVSRDIAILANFSKEERKEEEQHFNKWFIQDNKYIYYISHPYEGEGDHLVDATGSHWLGTGFRTSRLAENMLSECLNTNINVLNLIDGRWYHLDTAFCPLPNGELMWYPGAFSEKSRKVIREKFTKSIEVSLEDALQFCCNAVAIGTNIFLPKNSNASKQLNECGYTTHEFNLSEFLKSGGAAKCLVLKL